MQKIRCAKLHQARALTVHFPKQFHAVTVQELALEILLSVFVHSLDQARI